MPPTEVPVSDEFMTRYFIASLRRLALNPIEQARAFRNLIHVTGWSSQTLAHHLSLTPAAVRRALALLALPVSVQDRIEWHDFPAATAYQITKLDAPDAQEELAARVVAEDLSRDQVIQAVRRLASGPSPSPPKGDPEAPTSYVVRTASGIKLTAEHPRGLDAPALLAALDEARAKLAAQLADDQATA